MKRKIIYILGVTLLGVQLAGCGELESPPASDMVNEERIVTEEPAQTEVNHEQMVRLDGQLYYSTGEESDIQGRCGVMDGEIAATVEEHQVPEDDYQSNFGAGYGFQYVDEDSIDVFMDKKWIRFNKESSQIPLIQDASPETSAMALYEYDGTSVKSCWLYDAAREQEVIDYLNKQEVQGIADIDVSSLSGPMYGITIGAKDGTERKFTWWDGYWITDTRQVYRVDIDFTEVKKNYDWKDPDTLKLTTFPNLYFLASASGTWNTDLLEKSEELNGKGLSLDIKEQKEDTITVQLINTTKVELTCGEYFGIQAQIDGVWYDIPPEEELAFNDIAQFLPAGEEIEKRYVITAFGNLPSGLYRIVVEGVAAEFSIKE